MKLRHVLLLVAFIATGWPTAVVSQGGEQSPSFEDASDICSRCLCTAANASTAVLGYDLLDCSRRNLRYMLANWPAAEFDPDDPDREVVFTLSGNPIGRLQQLPATRNALVFSCRHCQLDQLDGGLFIDVPNVYRVDLSWNRLTGGVLAGGEVFRGQFDGQSLVQLPLDELDLSNNNISRLAADTFRYVTGLRGLALAHNPLAGELTGETADALATLVHLEVLDLSFLALTAIGERVFAGMLSLHELALQGNRLAAVPDAVYRAHGLVALNLAENPFVELHIEQALPNLRHLNVSSMPWLGQIVVESFANANALRTLLCRSNRALGVFDMAIFSQLPELRELDLSHSELKHLLLPPGTGNFSNVHRAPVRYAPQLETLRLSGNSWHCDCELRAALILFGYDQLQPDDSDGGDGADDEARCETPYLLTSLHLADLPFIDVCDLPAHEDHRGPSYEKPAFLRPRAIFLSLLSVGIVVGLGFVIGLAVVCLKRKLNHTGLTGFTSSPVRYTSVRDSTISTAYQPQT
ncbi:chondroadherin-like [Anopheles albimanus]|uniref:Uncharacterized protein n=1 Tax=Anopheles albimanus TaxID=7167 RepID=A0A182FJM7_ANOAL|nr:chondroadherin-like [Anopheles albimanus]